MGVLPDGVRLFDRLSGTELLRYVGLLRRVPAGRHRAAARPSCSRRSA